MGFFIHYIFYHIFFSFKFLLTFFMRLPYILRYCGRSCFAQYCIIDIVTATFIYFWYQRHEDDKFVVERIHIFEFIARLIRHIPKSQFKMVRYYGFYASRKHKLYNMCKMLIPGFKIPFLKSKLNWRNLTLFTFEIDSLVCPKCKNCYEI